jgi:hypothetical protein
VADTESLRQVVHSRASLSTWFGIVLLFALFGVIVLAVIGPAPRGSDYEQTRAKKRAELLKTSREEAAKALTTYSWIDKNKGVARIPIERAMELTVAELAQQKPAAAGPIATPEPQAQPATSPSPAGVAQPGAAQPIASPSGQALAPASPPAQTSPSPATQPSPIPPSPAPSNNP